VLPAARCEAQYQLLLFEPYFVPGNIVRLIAGATCASSTSVASSRMLGTRQVWPPVVSAAQYAAAASHAIVAGDESCCQTRPV